MEQVIAVCTGCGDAIEFGAKYVAVYVGSDDGGTARLEIGCAHIQRNLANATHVFGSAGCYIRWMTKWMDVCRHPPYDEVSNGIH